MATVESVRLATRIRQNAIVTVRQLRLNHSK